MTRKPDTSVSRLGGACESCVGSLCWAKIRQILRIAVIGIQNVRVTYLQDKWQGQPCGFMGCAREKPRESKPCNVCQKRLSCLCFCRTICCIERTCLWFFWESRDFARLEHVSSQLVAQSEIYREHFFAWLSLADLDMCHGMQDTSVHARPDIRMHTDTQLARQLAAS